MAPLSYIEKVLESAGRANLKLREYQKKTIESFVDHNDVFDVRVRTDW